MNKYIIFDLIQLIIVIILLSFYLTSSPDKESPCDINTNVEYSLYQYILSSLSLYAIISSIYIFCGIRKKSNCLYTIILTVAYIIVIVITIFGIFIAQQMNVEHDCYEFFTQHKNILSIYIAILFLTLMNIIYNCMKCRNVQEVYNHDEYRPLLINM